MVVIQNQAEPGQDMTKKALSDRSVVKCLNFLLRINLFAITNTAYYS